MSAVLDEIFANQDIGYKEFFSKLVPNVKNILGLRAPVAKGIAKKYADTAIGQDFLNSLPHTYYEENLVHGYMLGFLKDNQEEQLLKFLPYVDNWGVCDSMVSNLKQFFKCTDQRLVLVKDSLNSKHDFIIRFALVALLNYYVEPKYIDFVLQSAKAVSSDEYYVKMANAWLISVCLVKEYDITVKLLEERALDKWTHNKAIQKAIESYRITNEQKNYLRSIKIK